MQPRTKNGPSWANDAGPVLNSPPFPNTKLAKSATPEHTASAEETEQKDGEISDLDWMRRHMAKNVDSELASGEKELDKSDEKPVEVVLITFLFAYSITCGQSSSDEAPKDSTKDTILQTSRLFLRNLAFSCSDADLLELFKPFGDVSQVRIFVVIFFAVENLLETRSPR
jgi:multiple RNA-binding domain-containing protein 1